ncbi:holo-ACP synthase [Neisseria shayeganii]|nr:holo-ACP synthase [Neisseria shayeganii]
MIYGIGTDMLDSTRIERMHAKFGQALAEKILSRIELLELPSAGNPVNYLAKRFAAKEAFAKAVHTGLRSPVTLHHISVGHDSLGRPEFIVEPPLQAWLDERGIRKVHLSLSDEGKLIMAFAVAEKAA